MDYKYRITGIDCANCASKVEKSIGKLDGVKNAVYSFLTQKLSIAADSDLTEAIEKAVKKLEPSAVVRKI